MDFPQTVDLRVDAGWIVPVVPDGVRSGYALVVDQGLIAGILPAAQADRLFAPRERVRLDGHVLLPGLVNAHAHTAMSLLRGIADDLPLKPWLEEEIWPREAQHLSPEFVFDGTLLGAAEMLRGGVTCCNDMYFYPDAAARAFDAAGMRAMLGMPVLEFPTPYAADPQAYLQRGLAARDAWAHRPQLSFSLAPHAPYTVSDATWRDIVTYARQLDLPIQTHVAETLDEVDAALAATGTTSLARLDALDVTGPQFIAIHGVHLGEADLAILARQQSHVVHCPASNMKLASGVAPVAELMRRGINVALGTDGAASNNRFDLWSEMRLASLLAKVTSGDPAVVPAATALAMATRNGARALGLEARIGSLEIGKEADFIAVDLTAIETIPVYDPLSHLVHAAGREHVTDVWIAGVRVVHNRTLTTIDVAALTARAGIWQDALQ